MSSQSSGSVPALSTGAGTTAPALLSIPTLASTATAAAGTGTGTGTATHPIAGPTTSRVTEEFSAERLRSTLHSHPGLTRLAVPLRAVSAEAATVLRDHMIRASSKLSFLQLTLDDSASALIVDSLPAARALRSVAFTFATPNGAHAFCRGLATPPPPPPPPAAPTIDGSSPQHPPAPLSPLPLHQLHVEHSILSNRIADSTALAHLSTYLAASHCHLHTLALPFCGLESIDISTLAIGVRAAALTSVDLSGNPFGDDGISILVDALAISASIKSLKLARTQSSDAALKAISTFLIRPAKPKSIVSDVKSIDPLPLVPATATAVARVWAGLVDLNLKHNHIHDYGVLALASALKPTFGYRSSAALTNLQLRWNAVSSTAIGALADALQSNRSVVECDLESESAALAAAVRMNQRRHAQTAYNWSRIAFTVRFLRANQSNGRRNDVVYSIIPHVLAFAGAFLGSYETCRPPVTLSADEEKDLHFQTTNLPFFRESKIGQSLIPPPAAAPLPDPTPADAFVRRRAVLPAAATTPKPKPPTKMQRSMTLSILAANATPAPVYGVSPKNAASPKSATADTNTGPGTGGSSPSPTSAGSGGSESPVAAAKARARPGPLRSPSMASLHSNSAKPQSGGSAMLSPSKSPKSGALSITSPLSALSETFPVPAPTPVSGLPDSSPPAQFFGSPLPASAPVVTSPPTPASAPAVTRTLAQPASAQSDATPGSGSGGGGSSGDRPSDRPSTAAVLAAMPFPLSTVSAPFGAVIKVPSPLRVASAATDVPIPTLLEAAAVVSTKSSPADTPKKLRERDTEKESPDRARERGRVQSASSKSPASAGAINTTPSPQYLHKRQPSMPTISSSAASTAAAAAAAERDRSDIKQFNDAEAAADPYGDDDEEDDEDEEADEIVDSVVSDSQAGSPHLTAALNESGFDAIRVTDTTAVPKSNAAVSPSVNGSGTGAKRISPKPTPPHSSSINPRHGSRSNSRRSSIDTGALSHGEAKQFRRRTAVSLVGAARRQRTSPLPSPKFAHSIAASATLADSLLQKHSQYEESGVGRVGGESLEDAVRAHKEAFASKQRKPPVLSTMHPVSELAKNRNKTHLRTETQKTPSHTVTSSGGKSISAARTPGTDSPATPSTPLRQLAASILNTSTPVASAGASGGGGAGGVAQSGPVNATSPAIPRSSVIAASALAGARVVMSRSSSVAGSLATSPTSAGLTAPSIPPLPTPSPGPGTGAASVTATSPASSHHTPNPPGGGLTSPPAVTRTLAMSRINSHPNLIHASAAQKAEDQRLIAAQQNIFTAPLHAAAAAAAAKGTAIDATDDTASGGNSTGSEPASGESDDTAFAAAGRLRDDAAAALFTLPERRAGRKAGRVPVVDNTQPANSTAIAGAAAAANESPPFVPSSEPKNSTRKSKIAAYAGIGASPLVSPHASSEDELSSRRASGALPPAVLTGGNRPSPPTRAADPTRSTPPNAGLAQPAAAATLSVSPLSAASSSPSPKADADGNASFAVSAHTAAAIRLATAMGVKAAPPPLAPVRSNSDAIASGALAQERSSLPPPAQPQAAMSTSGALLMPPAGFGTTNSMYDSEGRLLVQPSPLWHTPADELLLSSAELGTTGTSVPYTTAAAVYGSDLTTKPASEPISVSTAAPPSFHTRTSSMSFPAGRPSQTKIVVDAPQSGDISPPAPAPVNITTAASPSAAAPITSSPTPNGGATNGAGKAHFVFVPHPASRIQRSLSASNSVPALGGATRPAARSVGDATSNASAPISGSPPRAPPSPSAVAAVVEGIAAARKRLAAVVAAGTKSVPASPQPVGTSDAAFLMVGTPAQVFTASQQRMQTPAAMSVPSAQTRSYFGFDAASPPAATPNGTASPAAANTPPDSGAFPSASLPRVIPAASLDSMSVIGSSPSHGAAAAIPPRHRKAPPQTHNTVTPPRTGAPPGNSSLGVAERSPSSLMASPQSAIFATQPPRQQQRAAPASLATALTASALRTRHQSPAAVAPAAAASSPSQLSPTAQARPFAPSGVLPQLTPSLASSKSAPNLLPANGAGTAAALSPVARSRAAVLPPTLSPKVAVRSTNPQSQSPVAASKSLTPTRAYEPYSAYFSPPSGVTRLPSGTGSAALSPSNAATRALSGAKASANGGSSGAAKPIGATATTPPRARLVRRYDGKLEAPGPSHAGSAARFQMNLRLDD